MALNEQIQQRTTLAQEFGIENLGGHLNCYLNSCLQLIWNTAYGRHLVLKSVQMPLNQNSELDLFVKALKEFYLQAAQVTSEVRTLDPKGVRRELFKLYYRQNEFVIHEKADASEALDKILGLLHA